MIVYVYTLYWFHFFFFKQKTAYEMRISDRSSDVCSSDLLLTTLIGGGFINAQRGLDDDTIRERDVLGKVVEVLFQSALTDDINTERRTTAEQLKDVVEAIQGDVHNSFNSGLTSLLPTFDLFGYPSLSDPRLVTETRFRSEERRVG